MSRGGQLASHMMDNGGRPEVRAHRCTRSMWRVAHGESAALNAARLRAARASMSLLRGAASSSAAGAPAGTGPDMLGVVTKWCVRLKE